MATSNSLFLSVLKRLTFPHVLHFVWKSRSKTQISNESYMCWTWIQSIFILVGRSIGRSVECVMRVYEHCTVYTYKHKTKKTYDFPICWRVRMCFVNKNSSLWWKRLFYIYRFFLFVKTLVLLFTKTKRISRLKIRNNVNI